MDTVNMGEKDCEEETLQTAFKKLRVDAERYLLNATLFKMYYVEYPSKTHTEFFLFTLQIPGTFVQKLLYINIDTFYI